MSTLNLFSLTRFIVNKQKNSGPPTLAPTKLERLIHYYVVNRGNYNIIKEKISFKNIAKINAELIEIREKNRTLVLNPNEIDRGLVKDILTNALVEYYRTRPWYPFKFSEFSMDFFIKILRDKTDVWHQCMETFLENTNVYITLAFIRMFGVLSEFELSILNTIEEEVNKIITGGIESQRLTRIDKYLETDNLAVESDLTKVYFLNNPDFSFNVDNNIATSKLNTIIRQNNGISFSKLKEKTNNFDKTLVNKTVFSEGTNITIFDILLPFIIVTRFKPKVYDPKADVIVILHVAFSLSDDSNLDLIRSFCFFTIRQITNAIQIMGHEKMNIILFNNKGEVKNFNRVVNDITQLQLDKGHIDFVTHLNQESSSKSVNKVVEKVLL